MARNHARILTAIWNDEDFLALTPDAQRMYFVALSQPTLSYAGVVALTVRRWAKLARGLTAAKVASAIAELAKARFVVVDQDTEELWVRSFVKHDGVIDQPGLVVAMAKDFLAIQSTTIRGQVLDRLGAGWLGGLALQFPRAFGDGFPDGFPGGFVDEFQRHFPDGSADESSGGTGGVSARVRPSSPYPSPSPPPQPPAEPGGGDPPSSVSPSSPSTVEEEEEPRLDEATAAAVAAEVERRLRDRGPAKEHVVDRAAWRAKVRRGVLAEVAEGGLAVLDPPRQSPNGGPKGDPGERAAAAQRAIAERNEARLRGESACGKCSDSGVFEREDGSVSRCDCTATTTADHRPTSEKRSA